jgi:hypothetical protein
MVAAIALSYVRTSAARTALLAETSNPHPAVRQGVAYALGYFQDETGAVREALTRMATTDAWSYTDPKTGAPRYSVRESAQGALTRLDKAQPLAMAAATAPTIPVYAPPPTASATPATTSAPATASAWSLIAPPSDGLPQCLSTLQVPQPDLSRKTGGYVFDFCRLQQGMRVLPTAVVGVRAYDRKVVQWTSDYQTLNIPLKPNLTLEQALDSLKAYLADFKWVPGMVLESGLEVVTFKRQQRLAWGLKIEIHGARNAREDTLDGFCFCHLDSNDGAVLDRQFPAVGVDTYRWYQAKGGKHTAMIGGAVDSVSGFREFKNWTSGGRPLRKRGRGCGACTMWRTGAQAALTAAWDLLVVSGLRHCLAPLPEWC